MKKIDWLNHFFNFIAVILGVFLAFWVSTRAEKIKDKRELQEIVVSLIDDLKSDQNTYQNYQIPLNEMQSDNIARLIIGIKTSNTDTITDYLSAALGIENFSPTSSTYLSISTSGKINLIDDLAIRYGLSDYYDVLSVESQEKGKVQVDFFLNQITPWLMDHIDLTDPDPEQLANSTEFANRLILFQTFIDNKTEGYHRLYEAAGVLEEKLKKLLNE